MKNKFSFHRLPKFKIALAATALGALIVVGPRACFWLEYGPAPDSIHDSILNVDQGFVFPPGFPPDPGKEGKKTIMGIDSDNDGVRDDVQRWIYALFPEEPKKQMAFRQWARLYQHSLQEEFGPEVRKVNKRLLDRAIDCQYKIFENTSRAYFEGQHLKAKILNTFDRTARYLDNDRKYTFQEVTKGPGHVETEDPQPCDNQ